MSKRRKEKKNKSLLLCHLSCSTVCHLVQLRDGLWGLDSLPSATIYGTWARRFSDWQSQSSDENKPPVLYIYNPRVLVLWRLLQSHIPLWLCLSSRQGRTWKLFQLRHLEAWRKIIEFRLFLQPWAHGRAFSRAQFWLAWPQPVVCSSKLTFDLP